MNQGDVVILLTDGDIFDIDRFETQLWFKKVASKASFKIAGYTHKPLQASGFSTTHIILKH
jgi:hypothetical protein